MIQKNIFLIDAVGAVISAVMLGIVLPRLGPFIGMPSPILYALAAAPCCFAVYSFACHFMKPKRRQMFLRGIAALNLFYCIASLTLMIVFWQWLTVWGVIYFSLEKLVVLILVFFEFSTGQRESSASGG